MSTYTGPSAREMLDSHTLAKETIERANGPLHERIFDDAGLSRLRRWCADPSSKQKLLDEEKALNGGGEEPEGKAQGNSLVCYLMTQSLAGNDLLTPQEMEQLNKWFESRQEQIFEME